MPVLIGTLPAEYDAEPAELVERAQHDLRRRDARHQSPLKQRIRGGAWHRRVRTGAQRKTRAMRNAKCAGPMDDASALCVWRCRCLAGVQACLPLETSGRRYMVGVHIDAALVVHDLEAKKVAPVCRQLHRSVATDNMPYVSTTCTAPCHVHHTNPQRTVPSLSRVRRRNHIRPKGWARALPHLHRDWARACHICTRTGLTPCHICTGTVPSLIHLPLSDTGMFSATRSCLTTCRACLLQPACSACWLAILS